MKIGHAHLKVRDLKIAEEFYRKVFDLKVSERVENRFVFLTGTDMHHEIALQQVGANAKQPGRFDVGLFHVAFEVPDKRSLAQRYLLLTKMNIQPVVVDHRISWAMYFSDPDNNGLEIYCDTRSEHVTEDWNGIDTKVTERELLLEL